MVRKSSVLLLIVIFLITSGLAGCIGDAGDDDEGENGPGAEAEGPTELDWWLSGCRVVVAIVPVDVDALAQHLPEGFAPVSGEDAFGLPSDPRGEGALALEAFDCESGSGLEGELEDFDYGAIFSPVTAPENLTDPDADIQFYKWETLVQDEPRRALLQDHGLPAVTGETDLSTFQSSPAGHFFDVQLELDGAMFQITGSAGEPNEAFRQGFYFQELQEADHGFGEWVSMENKANDGNSGVALVQLDPNHWSSDVVGTDASQAFVVASPDVNFLEGVIRLPS